MGKELVLGIDAGGSKTLALAAGLDGDRGLGPLLAAHPELVAEVPVAGANPDVDTPGDLDAVAAVTGGAR